MTLGKLSRERLLTCHPELQVFVMKVAEGVEAGECEGVDDITVLCGWRGEASQNEAFRAGNSKLQWPNSKHNSVPSNAVDIAPYPVDWDNKVAFSRLRIYAKGIARGMGLDIRTISWDLPHYERRLG
jgi:peptidoglycan L-alanyl-D-glutamate endopeptidase CwlK